MKGPDLSRYKRSWGFAIAVLLLMGVFFLGYFFYYIPFNRQSLQKDAFLTLQNISQQFNGRIDDRKVLFRNYLDARKVPPGKVAALQSELSLHQIGGRAVAYRQATDTILPVDSAIALAAIQNQQLIFSTHTVPGVAIALPVSDILSRLLYFQKNEFFRSFILVGKNDGIIYKDADIGIRSDVSVDSLLSKGFTAYVAGVKDIRMEDEDYKLFYYPFQADHLNLILCGFIKSDTYNGRLQNIPVGFIYPLIVCFLLLLIFLPVIKFYVMGVNEQVKFTHLVYFIASIFIGSSLLTLTIIQVLLMLGADARSEKDLRQLSGQIKSAFYEEVRQAYRRVSSVDSFMLVKKDSLMNDSVSFSPLLERYMIEHQSDSGSYYNFSQVQWVDSQGRQTLKGDFRNTHAVRVNVNDRQYFSVYRDNRPLPLPGVPGRGFGIEPLVSRTTGEFIVVISRKSADKKSVVASSNHMYSISDVIMSAGYGFCLIDGDGNVLIHSDSIRNLQENFFEKLVSYRGLKEVVASRQQKFFPDLFFYGKSHALNIEPLDRMPFYLVTFADKGYVFPVNMRILTFSLLGSLVSYLFCVLAWILLFTKRLYKYHLLYSPMRLFEWAFPQRRLSSFYRKAGYFLVVYAGLMLIVLVISGRLDVSDMGILVLALLSPLNVVAGLILVHNVNAHHGQNKNLQPAIRIKPVRLAFAILYGLLILHILFKVPDSDYPWVAVLFQALLVIGLTIYWQWKKGEAGYEVPEQQSDKYYRQYSLLALLMIINLSIVPAGIFTWYPHNQEIIQTVKKQQLYLATRVQERRPRIALAYRSLESFLKPPASYVYDRQFKSGIYSINHDSIFPGIDRTAPESVALHDNFYFGIADAISNNYYDPQSYPALTDRANDNAWYWTAGNGHIRFRSDMNADTTGMQTNTISILSSLPQRYMYVVKSWKGLLLVSLLAVALWAMYVVIKTVCSKIFLRKYVQISLAMNATPSVECTNLLPEEEATESINTNIENGHLEIAERKVIELLKIHRRYYKEIWNQCSEKEKYLLFDFAHDGLLNYNNTIEIYNLIDKGILVVNRQTDDISICSRGFRAYIILQKGSPELVLMQKSYEANSTWQSFRLPFMILLLAIAGFIFFTQEATFQKIAALVTGISTISTLLLKLPFGSKPDLKAS